MWRLSVRVHPSGVCPSNSLTSGRGGRAYSYGTKGTFGTLFFAPARDLNRESVNGVNEGLSRTALLGAADTTQGRTTANIYTYS